MPASNDRKLAIHMTLLDALQHYRATPDITTQSTAKKVDTIETLLRQSAKENGLFEGDDRANIGEAWSRFLRSSKHTPTDVVSLIEDKRINEIIEKLDRVRPTDAPLTLQQAKDFTFGGPMRMLRMAQLKSRYDSAGEEYGIIRHSKGESLSDTIDQLSQQIAREPRLAVGSENVGSGLLPPKAAASASSAIQR